MVQFLRNSQNRQTHGKQIGGCQCLEEGELEEEQLLKGNQVLFWCDENACTR
jgi:hypothetical protein